MQHWSGPGFSGSEEKQLSITKQGQMEGGENEREREESPPPPFNSAQSSRDHEGDETNGGSECITLLA